MYHNLKLHKEAELSAGFARTTAQFFLPKHLLLTHATTWHIFI